MTNIDSSKAARIDKISVRFLKDGTKISVKPISEISQSHRESSQMLANLRN